MARAVQCLNLAQALQAHTALVQRSIGIALDLHHFAILGVHANRTAIRATVTCGFMHHTLNRLRGKRLVGVLEQLHGFRGRQSRTAAATFVKLRRVMFVVDMSSPIISFLIVSKSFLLRHGSA